MAMRDGTMIRKLCDFILLSLRFKFAHFYIKNESTMQP